MFRDGQIIFTEAVNWLKQEGYEGDIFLMGRSLGSACAIDLASINAADISGLIIESGFANTTPLAEHLGIDLKQYQLTEDDGFNNIAKIQGVTKPTYILHGAADELIPAYEGEKLQAASAARMKQFQIIPGASHNTMIQTGGSLYFQAIKQFIDQCTGESSWRVKRRAYRR
jgi:alpha-beta hydrolase superfamily lysophospholipase